MNYTQTQEVNIAMNSNRDLFEKASVPKAVALMAIPTIVTMLVVVIYNMADTFFIGQTGDAMQVAAVSLATPVFMVFMALGNLFGSVEVPRLTCTCEKMSSVRDTFRLLLLWFSGRRDTDDTNIHSLYGWYSQNDRCQSGHH